MEFFYLCKEKMEVILYNIGAKKIGRGECRLSQTDIVIRNFRLHLHLIFSRRHIKCAIVCRIGGF